MQLLQAGLCITHCHSPFSSECVMSQEISDTRVSRHLGQFWAVWCGHFCGRIDRVPETEPTHRPSYPSRDRPLARRRSARQRVHVLRRARHRPQHVLRPPRPSCRGRAGRGAGAQDAASEVQSPCDHRRGEAAGSRGAGSAGVIRAGSRPDQCPRQDDRTRIHGPVGRVIGADFPADGGRPQRAAEEAAASYRRFVYPAPNACWQLDATEYVLAGGPLILLHRTIPTPVRTLPSYPGSPENAGFSRRSASGSNSSSNYPGRRRALHQRILSRQINQTNRPRVRAQPHGGKRRN